MVFNSFSDASECKSTEFVCLAGPVDCLNASHICNGELDCYDLSDERNCEFV